MIITEQQVKEHVDTAMKEIIIANAGLPSRVKYTSWAILVDGYTTATLQIYYTDGDGRPLVYNIRL